MRVYRYTVRPARRSRPGGVIGLVGLIVVVGVALDSVSHTLAVAVGVLVILALIARYIGRTVRRDLGGR